MVADRFGPTLALVPLNAKPRKTTQSEVDQFLQRTYEGSSSGMKSDTFENFDGGIYTTNATIGDGWDE